MEAMGFRVYNSNDTVKPEHMIPTLPDTIIWAKRRFFRASRLDRAFVSQYTVFCFLATPPLNDLVQFREGEAPAEPQRVQAIARSARQEPRPPEIRKSFYPLRFLRIFRA